MLANRSRLISFAVAAVAIAALIIHVRRYPVLTHDDAFISLRYVQRFLAGHGLTWTDGPPVEGYSNLLWVLGCALLASLGVELLVTPVVLGVASAIGIIAAVVCAFPPSTWRESLPAFAGAMFIALAGPIGLWAVAGLEGCLVGALLAWSLVLLRRLMNRESDDPKGALLAGIPLALLCLTRPDGALFTIVACGVLLVRSRTREDAVTAVRVAVLPGFAILGQLGFRLAYYGDWVPNTARAKVALATARVEGGVMCVADAGHASYALWVPAMLALYVAWRDPRRRPRIGLTFACLAAWTAYSATVACEPYGFRMLIPCYVLLAFLVAETFDWLQAQRHHAGAAAWIAAFGLLAWFAYAQQTEPSIVLAQQERPPATFKGATIGNTLRDAFHDRDPLLAVDAAGAIPFFSGFRSLDMLGLNDAHIARRRSDSFGDGTQGHELGDGAYVLSRAPDLIVSKRLGASHLAFKGGREMEADPRFDEAYRRVRMQGDRPVPWAFYVFSRLEGRAGIERSEGLVTIPGYLFANRRGTEAHLGDDGTPGVRFVQSNQVALEGVELATGTWALVAEGTVPVRMTVRAEPGAANVTQTADGLELVLVRPGPVEISVLAEPSTFLARVTARRVGD